MCVKVVAIFTGRSMGQSIRNRKGVEKRAKNRRLSNEKYRIFIIQTLIKTLENLFNEFQIEEGYLSPRNNKIATVTNES